MGRGDDLGVAQVEARILRHPADARLRPDQDGVDQAGAHRVERALEARAVAGVCDGAGHGRAGPGGAGDEQIEGARGGGGGVHGAHPGRGPARRERAAA